ncbi:alcohol dehydrogenase GroES domain protein [Amanita muscaria]
MKAARYYGPGDIRIEEIDKPVPKSGQVLIKVCICGTDLHAFLARTPKFPTATEPDPITGETLPVTLGHEFSGTIVEHGPGVDSQEWPIDQPVTVEPIFACEKIDSCDTCADGRRNTCPLFNTIGIGGWGGGLAEFIAVDAKYVHKLHPNIPLEIGACMEPISVAWHAVKRSKFAPGQSALVLGAGPIGFLILKVLRSVDANATIIIAEPAELRRSLAKRHGATIVIDPTVSDISKVVLENTGGAGVHVALDAAGLQSTTDAAVDSVRSKGTIVNVALWDAGVKVAIDLNKFVLKEITLTGTICYENDHPEVIAAIATGKITGIEEFISRKIALEDVVEKGFKALIQEKSTIVKVLVHP